MPTPPLPLDDARSLYARLDAGEPPEQITRDALAAAETLVGAVPERPELIARHERWLFLAETRAAERDAELTARVTLAELTSLARLAGRTPEREPAVRASRFASDMDWLVF